MKNEKAKKIAKKIFEIRKSFLRKRDEWLEKETAKYKEEYYVAYLRQPESFEISRFRKDKVMKVALKIYLVLIVIGFILWTMITSGGGMG